MTMTKIETIALGSAQSAITFSSIPQTYTDLYLVFSLRGTNGSPDNELQLAINGSDGTDIVMYGFGSGSAGSNPSASKIRGNQSGNGATANTFGNGYAYIPNYTSTGQKSVSMDTAGETNATAVGMYVTAGLTTSTAAVTTIAINCVANNWMTGSIATLYGILKGSGGATVS